MDLASVAYWLKLCASVVGALWALIVLYDVIVADTKPGKITLHVIYALLSLVVVLFATRWQASLSNASYAVEEGERQLGN
jgi:uncharacterized membrane protein